MVDKTRTSNGTAGSIAAASAGDMNRRQALGLGLGALALAPGLFPRPALAQARQLRVGAYGGYFEDSFKKHVYPAFTKATGIEVVSVTQPNSADWLITMQQAAQSGTVPTDVSLYGKDTMIKASRLENILKPLETARIPNLGNLGQEFVYEDKTGLVGVGAMSWFASMVINPNEVEQPASWAEFWDGSRFKSSLGMSNQFTSRLLDVTAATFFEGPAVLSTDEGVLAVIAKVGELKPNVALWWNAESQMEQGMKNQDVVGGMYFHDVAGLMAKDGFPIRSVFPKEGNPIDYGSWCLSAQSDKAEEAAAFISFSSDPSTQALMSRQIGTSPLVARDKLDLTDEEFAAVSGTPHILPNYEAYLDKETFISESWQKMLASA